MAVLHRSRRLRKELGLLDVYVMATGTTLSAGFFLLPGLAAMQAGPGLVLAYALAAVPLIPAMLSKVELATAMPRAGGTYYFLDRSLGPLVGTIGGLGTWLALVLKSAFSLVAMGAYLTLFFPELSIVPLACGVTAALAALNLLGTRQSGRFQIAVVGVLLVLLTGFIAGSLPQVRLEHFRDTLGAGAGSILSTAGLVYVGYIGLTKVISLAEEVREPDRNLPLGVFLAIGTTLTIYTLGTFAMVGVLGADRLAGDLTPAASTARSALGEAGAVAISVAAVLASLSVANAGLISASRYPLAMSRDHLIPHALLRLNARGVPGRALALTAAVILACLLLIDPIGIAKLAGAFQLLVFSLLSIAVIVMRESRLDSYDPGYRAPGYPWLQIGGIVAPLVLIASMGWQPVLFAAGIVGIGAAWYFTYARRRVHRAGALLHVFERLGRQRHEGLELELRGILKEKGLRRADRFDEVVARAPVIDVRGDAGFETVVRLASDQLAARLGQRSDQLAQGFLDGTRIGATPVEHGVAIPHLRLAGIPAPELVIVRTLDGLDPQSERDELLGEEPIHASFFLVSPEGDASRHLRFLAQLAVRVEEPGFMSAWRIARDEGALKEILLRSERSLAVTLEAGRPLAGWIGKTPGQLALPPGVLIALLRRGDETIVPGGSTGLLAGDRLTLIGEPRSISALRRQHAEEPDAAD